MRISHSQTRRGRCTCTMERRCYESRTGSVWREIIMRGATGERSGGFAARGYRDTRLIGLVVGAAARVVFAGGVAGRAERRPALRLLSEFTRIHGVQDTPPSS